MQLWQIAKRDGAPPIVSGVITLLAVAHFSQNSLPVLVLLCFAFSPQAFPLSVPLSVGAWNCGNLSGKPEKRDQQDALTITANMLRIRELNWELLKWVNLWELLKIHE